MGLTFNTFLNNANQYNSAHENDIYCVWSYCSNKVYEHMSCDLYYKDVFVCQSSTAILTCFGLQEHIHYV